MRTLINPRTSVVARRLILLVLCFAVGLPLRAAQPYLAASGRAFGGTGTDMVTAITSGSAGLALAGAFEGTLAVGTTNLTSAGQQDIWVARLQSNGSPVWAWKAGGSSLDRAEGVAVDGAGGVAVCGYFNGTASFGATNLVSAVGTDAFLARLAPDGTLAWVRRLSGSSDDFANAVAIGVDGRIYVAGAFVNYLNVSGQTLLTNTHFSQALFVACFDTNGQPVWASQAEGVGALVSARRLVVAGDGAVYAAGHFSGALIFNGQPLTSAGDYDAGLLKFTSNGAPVWARNAGGTGYDFAQGVGVLSGGDVCVSGGFSGSAQIGTNTFGAGAANNFFVARYSSQGEVVWVRSLTNASSSGLAVDGDDHVWAVGDFTGTTTFAGQSISAGTQHSLVAEILGDGTPFSLLHLDGGNSVIAQAVSVGSGGALCVVGYFDGLLTAGNVLALNAPSGGGGLDSFFLTLESPAFALRIDNASQSFHLSWPDRFTSAQIESADVLTAATNWSNFAVTATNGAGMLHADVLRTNSHRFFRLRRPF